MTARLIILAFISLGCFDLVLREVARRSLLAWAGLPAVSAGPVTLIVVVAALAGVFLFARTRHPRRSDGAVALLLAAAFAGGLLAQQHLGARLQSDGFYYFAYLRSLWFDRDVNFTNDYRLLGLGNKPHLFQPTPTGHAQSAWTIGPAIAWSPFFAGGDLVARGLAASGQDVARDGTSFPYRQAVCVAGLFYGLLGVWFCYRLAALFLPARLAALSAATASGGSFMLWYLIKEPSMTHAPSMAAVAAFTYFWAATRQRRSLRQWALLGLVAGLATTIRWQNAIFALLPAIEAVQLLFDAWRARSRRAATCVVAGGVVFTAAATVAFLPQMLAWKAIYGSYVAVSPIGPPILWTHPAIVNILWSSRNGLLATSPVLYLAALGLLAVPRIDRRFGIAALVTFAVMVYFNSTILDWWGSAGFGMRRFDGMLPLLTVGLALFLRGFAAFAARRPSVMVGAAIGLLVVWNLAFVQGGVTGSVRIGEALSFGDLAGYQARAVHSWFGYPFSYPVNLVYALRNGVSPARYDLLAPSTFLGDPRQPFGKIDVGANDEVMLGNGWYDAERDGAITYRWATSSCLFIVPLDHTAALGVQLRLQPFTFPAAPAQTVKIGVNGTFHGPFALAPGWQEVRFETPAREWHAGVNRVVLEFSRQNAPAQVGLSGDQRMLAAAIDYFRIREMGR
jgi:hypothetical protein